MARGSLDLEAAKAQAYPLLTSTAMGQERPTLTAIPDTGPQKQIATELATQIQDPHAIAALALAAMRRGGRILVIRNTVTDCLATQQAMEAMLAPRRTWSHGDCWPILPAPQPLRGGPIAPSSIKPLSRP